MLEGVAHRHRDLGHRKRLFEKIVRPKLGCTYRALNISVPRNHDHDRLRGQVGVADALQRFQSVDAGQPDVEQHHGIHRGREHFQAALPAFGDCDRVAFVLEHAGERLADAGFVVHDQDAAGCAHTTASCRSANCFSTAGNSITKRVPLGWLSSTRMLPP